MHRSLKVGPKFVFVNDVEEVWAKQLLKKNHRDWSEARPTQLNVETIAHTLALLIEGDL